MMRLGFRVGRFVALFALIAVWLIVSGACQSRNKRPLPVPEGVAANDIVDANLPAESLGPLESSELTKLILDRQVDSALHRRAREEKIGLGRDGKPYRQKEYNVLMLSGGGVYGAYPAGLLSGWSASGLPPEEGGRPVFDVVTGVSTGALIAPFAFLGPEYDLAMKQEYTTVRRRDIFKIRATVRQALQRSFVDNSPLRERIERSCTPEFIAKIAAGHAEGRRLYIGTANLDTRQLVVWDIGAMATKGSEESQKLIVDVILASAAIPGLFPPVKLCIDIDGRRYEEYHVDGALARRMFFQPPHFSSDDPEPGRYSLAGTNLFALVSGKAYADAKAIRPRSLPVFGTYVANGHYVALRGDLDRIYNYSLLTGMDFFTAAIPPDLDVTKSIIDFNPAETTKMFEAGFQRGVQGAFRRAQKVNTDQAPKPFAYPDGSPILFKEPGPAWQNTPPGLESEARGPNRAGLNLKVNRAIAPTPGPSPGR